MNAVFISACCEVKFLNITPTCDEATKDLKLSNFQAIIHPTFNDTVILLLSRIFFVNSNTRKKWPRVFSKKTIACNEIKKAIKHYIGER